MHDHVANPTLLGHNAADDDKPVTEEAKKAASDAELQAYYLYKDFEGKVCLQTR